MSNVTLSDGDLVIWNPGEGEEPVPLLVQGDELLFQFGTKPWSQMIFEHGSPGLTRPEAELVLRNGRPWELPGYIFKGYDNATGQSFADPNLDADPLISERDL